jgi:hypothetical protein
MNSVAFDVNHGFMFRFCKGNALASGNENSVPCLFVTENDKVLWKAFTDLIWWDPWHLLRDVFGVLQRRSLVNEFWR